jgi:DNA-binding beta-propeller fold protein YncE
MGAIRGHGAAVRRPFRLTRTATLAAVAATSVGLGGCSLVSEPTPPTVVGPSQALPGTFAYAVCPDAVTPVELATGSPEADIPLGLSGTPAPGDFAIATSPDGRWAYVVTTDGVSGAPAPGGTTPVTTGAATTAPQSVGQNVVVPVDLVTQQAEAPIDIPGTGLTHGIVVLPDGTTVLASSGDTVVPVDVATRKVGVPIPLGANHAVYGLALNPTGTLAYALVAGGVIPVDPVHGTAGAPAATGLAVSSVYSPHGIAVSADGATVYVIGQGGTDYGGRVLPISATTGALGPAASFDKYGIADPAAVAVSPDGTNLQVVDSANNWVNPLPVAAFAAPPAPVRLPAGTGGNEHPTDIVMGPGGTTAYIVEGFDSVLPYTPSTQTFGRAIPVCTGASSMALAPSPGAAAGS